MASRSPAFYLFFLYIAYFLVVANITLVLPLLPYMISDLMLSTNQATLLVVAFPVVALCSNLVIGKFIDAYGKKPFIQVGALGAAISFLIIGLSSDPVLILLGRATTGLFVPMIGATIFASISDLFVEQDRARYSGYVASVSSIAQLISIPISLIAGQWLSWRAPYLSFTVLCLLLLMLTPSLPNAHKATIAARSSDTVAPTPKAPFFSRELNTLLMCYVLFSLASFCVLAMYPSWLVSLDKSADWRNLIVIIFVVGGFSGFFGALLFGKLARTYSQPIKLCLIISLLMSCVMLPLPYFSSTIIAQIALYSLFSFLRAMFLPIIMASCMPLVADNRRSRLNGLINAAFQLSAASGGFVGAQLFIAFGSFQAVCLVGSIVFILSGLVCVFRPAK